MRERERELNVVMEPFWAGIKLFVERKVCCRGKKYL